MMIMHASLEYILKVTCDAQTQYIYDCHKQNLLDHNVKEDLRHLQYSIRAVAGVIDLSTT